KSEKHLLILSLAGLTGHKWPLSAAMHWPDLLYLRRDLWTWSALMKRREFITGTRQPRPSARKSDRPATNAVTSSKRATTTYFLVGLFACSITPGFAQTRS